MKQIPMKGTGKKWIGFIVWIGVLMLCPVLHLHAAEKKIPFLPGEKLKFQVRWSFIPAGEATLEILPFKKINGIRAFHFVMTARTSPFVDLFYKVRDTINSYTDQAMTHAILYKEKKTGKRQKDVSVHFDWEKQEVQYTNLGHKLKPVSIYPGTFDPLSVFYAFRLYDLKENMVIDAPVTDGKKCVMGKARVIRKQRIWMRNKEYDTFLVEPDIKDIGGVFEKSKDAQFKIWVSADERRIPIKIQSKVVVGSFIAELVSIE